MDSIYNSVEEDSDTSTSSSSSSSSSSSTNSSTNGQYSSDSLKRSDEELPPPSPKLSGRGYDVIAKTHLQQLAQRVDSRACLDDDSAQLLDKICVFFVNDVCQQVVQLAQFRKEYPRTKDLKFILKREYNMEFPK